MFTTAANAATATATTVAIAMIAMIVMIATNVYAQEDCNMFDYVPIDSDHCPHVDYLANLKVCEKANDNELCFSKGACGVKSDLNNCLYPNRDAHTYDIYVKHSKYRQLDYWENVSLIYENIEFETKVSYCSDNYLIHETDMDNPVFQIKKKYPLKTLSECQNECVNTALDSKQRRCEAYGWRTNGIPHTETTLNECKFFYKCEIKETQVISEISFNQLGAYIGEKDIPICKSGYAIDKTWCWNCHWSGGHRHWVRNEVIIFPNNTWCPKSDEILNIYGYNTEIDLTTDWIIVKGHFYNDKSTNTNTATTTSFTTKTTTTKTKTTTSFTTKTATTKTKTTTTKTKTTKTKTTKTNTLTTKTKTTTKETKPTSSFTTKASLSFTTKATSSFTTKTKKTKPVTTKATKSTNKKFITTKATHNIKPTTTTSTKTTSITDTSTITKTTSTNTDPSNYITQESINKHKNIIIILVIVIIIILSIPVGIYSYKQCTKDTIIPPDNSHQQIQISSPHQNSIHKLNNPPSYENPMYENGHIHGNIHSHINDSSV